MCQLGYFFRQYVDLLALLIDGGKGFIIGFFRRTIQQVAPGINFFLGRVEPR